MLVEQFARALVARFLQLALGLRAAESLAIGGSFRFRLLALCALPELFQIDQIPHGGPLMLVAGLQPTEGAQDCSACRYICP